MTSDSRVHYASRLAGTVALMASVVCVAASPGSQSFDIDAQNLASALAEFARQSDRQILFSTEVADDKRTQGVSGRLSPEEALRRLLEGTGLTYRITSDNTILVESARPSAVSGDAPVRESRLRLAQSAVASERAVTAPAATSAIAEPKIEELVVVGEAFRSINVDQPRSPDGPRPYTVIDRAAIERSGATSFADIARQLAFDTESRPETAMTGQENRQKASINFRGIGQNSTLVLINGRRAAPGYGGPYGQIQFDLNSLPLASIERIEILPYSASAIYGGSAMGGVINVVLRNDYHGNEVSVKVGSTTDGEGAYSGINYAGGYSTKSGKTNFSLSAGWQKEQGIQEGELGYLRHWRARTLEMNPNSVLNSTSPPSSRPGNVRSTNGAPLFGAGTPSNAGIPVGLDHVATLADFAGTAGAYNMEYYDRAQDALYLRPEKELLSFQIMANHQLLPNLNLFAELNFNENEAYSEGDSALTLTVPANNPFNPFGTAVSVTNFFDDAGGYDLSSETKTQRWVVGANGMLGSSWKYMADVIYEERKDAAIYAGRALGLQQDSYSATGLSPLKETDPARAYNPFADFSTGYRNSQEVLDRVLTDDIRSKSYDMISVALRLNGTLKELSWGRLLMAGGLEHRDENTTDLFGQYVFPATGQVLRTSENPEGGRRVSAAYTEISMPLYFSRDRADMPWFDVSLATRYEDYSDFGATANHQAALKFSPLRSLQFRVSWATGYTPPDIGSLMYPVFENPSVTVTDTNRQNEVVVVSQVSGGNPDLKAEEAESYSAGIIFTPPAVEGLRLSLDWFDIEKENQIIDSPTLAALLDNEPYLEPGRVVRAERTPADVAAGLPGVLLSLDRRAMNFTKLHTRGVDFAADYAFALAAGELALRGQGTYVDFFDRQTTPTSPEANFVGNPLASTSSPLRFRTTFGATYSRGQYAFTASGRYLSHYRAPATNLIVQGSDYVDSSLEFDLNATWQFSSSGEAGPFSSMLSGMRVNLGVNNIFNERAPFVAANTGYSLFNDPRGRFAYLQLRRQF